MEFTKRNIDLFINKKRIKNPLKKFNLFCNNKCQRNPNFQILKITYKYFDNCKIKFKIIDCYLYSHVYKNRFFEVEF